MLKKIIFLNCIILNLSYGMHTYQQIKNLSLEDKILLFSGYFNIVKSTEAAIRSPQCNTFEQCLGGYGIIEPFIESMFLQDIKIPSPYAIMRKKIGFVDEDVNACCLKLGSIALGCAVHNVCISSAPGYCCGGLLTDFSSPASYAQLCGDGLFILGNLLQLVIVTKKAIHNKYALANAAPAVLIGAVGVVTNNKKRS